MSAEILREAAALMRSRAEAARAGNWRTEPSALAPETTLVVAEWSDLRRVATCSGSLPEGNAANAEHIAAADPPFMLAVADWLFTWANTGWANGTGIHDKAALAVARAYLLNTQSAQTGAPS